MFCQEKEWMSESVPEAQNSKERKAELVKKLSGSLTIAAPMQYVMDLSRYPAYFQTHKYPKEELLGAVKPI